MKKSVILVLFGGVSSEYEVSLQSAYAVLANLDAARWVALPVGITREGRWFYYTGPLDALQDDSWHRRVADRHPCTLSLDRNRRELMVLDGTAASRTFDAAFPVMHGKNGEDGTLQGLLELTGIPVIGCGTLASALCMDKVRAHQLVAAAGVRVPRSAAFCGLPQEDALFAAAQTLGYPLFVKPVRAGSSFGITRVTSEGQLVAAVQQAAAYDGEIVLEEEIPGFEVGCAVLGNEQLCTGQVDEIELAGGFFDFEEKYTLKTSQIHCPARISAKVAGRIQQTAMQVYRILGCRVFARVDLFLTPTGEIVFNEVNTIPGFTSHSRYPNMMAKADISFAQLLTRICELAVQA